VKLIEVTIDGGYIIMDGRVDGDALILDGLRLDINEAESLRDILDACIRRINDEAREYNERQHAEQRRMEAEQRKRPEGKP
jgi:hypothetical protein